MQNWLKKHWQWASVNVFAMTVILLIFSELSATQARGISPPIFQHRLERTGVWAIRFLLLSLAMSPLYRLMGWRWMLKLRKPVGLWAFFFGAWHFITYIGNKEIGDIFQTITNTPFLLMGLTGLSILALLTLTSHPMAMRRLRRNWKRLHRLVYLAGILVLLHSILAFSNSKSAFIKGWGLVDELKLYLVVLSILLVLRLTIVQRLIQRFTGKPKRRKRQKPVWQS